MSGIRYPENFVKRVKGLFPDGEPIHELLDKNSVRVGICLDESATGTISAEAVIKHIDEGKIPELRSMAQRAIDIKSAFKAWTEFSKANSKSEN